MACSLPRLASAALLLLHLSGSAYAAPQNSNSTSFGKSCGALVDAGLGGQVFFPEDAEYVDTIESYYSADVQDIKPWCILQPESTDQVSKALEVLSSQDGRCWNVAIRSGGHSPFPTVNNVGQGVTIDLGKVNSVTVNDGLVSIGTGARWGDIYTLLESQGLMVGGGREGHVGVGGFLLGGGFTWYSPKNGMAADNVIAYEVVLADGSVVEATADQNADLFKALKGGLNNIGIVTRFDMRTFASHDIYGGVMAFPYASKDGILETFVAMVDNTDTYNADTGFVSFSWGPSTGSNVAFITANLDGAQNSSTFAGLKDLNPLVDMRSVQPITGLARALQSGLGLYNVWYSLTFHNTLDMGRKFVSLYESVVAELEGQIDEQITVIFLMTPLPRKYVGQGNILGLDSTLTKNSIVMQVEALLPSDKYVDLLTEKLRAATVELEAYAKATQQDVPWLYVNYANPEQDAIGSYGEENVRFLKETAAKYDPEGFFQARVGGAFKVTNTE